MVNSYSVLLDGILLMHNTAVEGPSCLLSYAVPRAKVFDGTSLSVSLCLVLPDAFAKHSV